MAKVRPTQGTKALCINCGEFKEPEEFYTSNHEKNSLKLTYVCKECSKKKIHEYRNTESGFWVGLWNNLTSGAKSRGLEVGITKEDVKGMWDVQGGLCAITKLPMEKVKAQRTTRSRSLNQFRASVDRIDSEQGYIPGNVRLVCAYVNVMKMDQTDDQLKFWCEAILKGMSNG